MDPAVIDKCQDMIGYRFSDPDLLALALTHSSVAPVRTGSNERLEFLGDAVLGMVVCERLFLQCEDLMEGDMTKIKSTAVSRQTCARIADQLGISALTVMSKGISRGTGLPQSVSAAVFEAILGAIFLDGGMDKARQFVLEHVQPHIDEALANEHQRNYKSVLQQYAQRQWSAVPIYQVLDEKGPDHSKCFEVAVGISGRNFASAWGKSKKEAEQEAARLALNELGLLKDEG